MGKFIICKLAILPRIKCCFIHLFIVYVCHVGNEVISGFCAIQIQNFTNSRFLVLCHHWVPLYKKGGFLYACGNIRVVLVNFQSL